MTVLLEIYKKLFKCFGPQGWWPIGGVYDPNKKFFSDREKFEICIGAILTQNTAWSNVEKALANLRKKSLLSFEKIAKIKRRELEKEIKPSGFYKQKAERLKNFANYVYRNYCRTSVRPEQMFGKCSPRTNVRLEKITRKELLALNGVGPETADSILLYALKKPYFVVDAYTRRIFKRIGLIDTDKYEDIRKFIEDNLPEDIKLFNEYHALIVKLAKECCRKKPECNLCPIKIICKKQIN